MLGMPGFLVYERFYLKQACTGLRLYYFFPNERILATTAVISSSDILALNAGMNLPFPFFVASTIWASVRAFCHFASLKSGCPFERQFGSPRPSLPWQIEHFAE